MKYLTQGQHQITINTAFFLEEIGMIKRGRIIKDFVNEHIIIQKAKRRKNKMYLLRVWNEANEEYEDIPVCRYIDAYLTAKEIKKQFNQPVEIYERKEIL